MAIKLKKTSEGQSVSTNITLPYRLSQRVKIYAVIKRVTMKSLIEKALIDYMKKNPLKPGEIPS